MKNIKLNFKTALVVDCFSDNQQPKGPLFHRWLPDGKNDAIPLPITSSGISIKVWFERFGKTFQDQIFYSKDEKDVDFLIMNKQGKLESGILFVECSNIRIQNDLVILLKKKKLNNRSLVKFAKDLYKDIIPRINHFIKILKQIYCQFWLKEIPLFDSREGSISYYWNFPLNANWKFKSGKKNYPFVVDELSKVIYALNDENKDDDSEFGNYITKSDWKEIEQHLRNVNFSNIVLESILKAYEHSLTNRLNYAFIDAHVALEVAINNFYKSKYKKDSGIKKKINDYLDHLDLSTKLVITASHYSEIKSSKLKNGLESLKIRNKVAHEGYLAKPSEKVYLYDLLDIVKIIAGLSFIRKSKIIDGNLSCSDEGWEEIYNQ